MPLQIIRQDITEIGCDVIVNATNERLQPGGSGVDAGIHAAAGPELLEECRKIGHIDIGSAAMTDAYGLNCKKIIHTAGPVWRGGRNREKELLESCYTEALKLADGSGYESVAFPLISSGAFGYPKDRVFVIAVDTIYRFLLSHDMTVYLVIYDKKSFSIGKKLFADVKEFIGDEPSDTKACRSINRRQTPQYDSAAPSRITRRGKLPSVNEALVCSDEVAEKCELPSSVNIEGLILNLDESFALKLMRLIDLKGMSDTDCYKKANVSRQTWHKILNDPSYRPSKNTVLSFAIALKLTYDETQALLETVGFTLSRSLKSDCIITYFLKNGNYNLFEIEATLFQFDQAPLCNT